MILAHTLDAILKRLVLGPTWATRRMKALRFALIALPGRVVRHGRRLIVKVTAAGTTLAWLLNARATIRTLVVGPSG